MALLTALVSFGLGFAYVSWMASYTESVEARNPALTATGLAIWGWIIRVVVFALFMVLPLVVSTVNPLVEYGARVATISKTYAAPLAKAATDPAGLAVVPKADLLFLQAHGPAVAKAAANNGKEWKHWYWVAFAGVIFFLGCIPLLKGRWSPSKARADEEAHEAMVEAEMAKLNA